MPKDSEEQSKYREDIEAIKAATAAYQEAQYEALHGKLVRPPSPVFYPKEGSWGPDTPYSSKPRRPAGGYKDFDTYFDDREMMKRAHEKQIAELEQASKAKLDKAKEANKQLKKELEAMEKQIADLKLQLKTQESFRDDSYFESRD
jgi:septin family protein